MSTSTSSLASTHIAAGRYTFPPEYAPQDAIWLGWSEEQRHHPVQVEMIRALLPHVAVRVMVRSDSARAEATRMLAAAGIDATRVGFVEHPLATNWIRDSGPRFVSDGRRLAVADSADAATNPLSAADRAILRENLAEMRAAVNVDGRPFHLVTLPMPGIQHYMWTGPLSEEDKRADAMGAWHRSSNRSPTTPTR